LHYRKIQVERTLKHEQIRELNYTDMIEAETIDWNSVKTSLNENGFAHLRGVISESECITMQSMFAQSELYRSVINMERYRFGKGVYKYFSYPLPPLVQQLRTTFYPPLSEVANDWMQKLQIENSFPAAHADLISHCHAHNQTRPTPLILRYEAGGYNTLHQDLYGDVYFPFQIVLMLSRPGKDFDGGEFILIEQLPRAQSRARVFEPAQGDAFIFTTNFRPVKGTKGYYRARMKHGVSEVKSGVRYAMGIIFHDAS
jgi:hypothetical protein